MYIHISVKRGIEGSGLLSYREHEIGCKQKGKLIREKQDSLIAFLLKRTHFVVKANNLSGLLCHWIEWFVVYCFRYVCLFVCLSLLTYTFTVNLDLYKVHCSYLVWMYSSGLRLQNDINLVHHGPRPLNPDDSGGIDFHRCIRYLISLYFQPLTCIGMFDEAVENLDFHLSK